MAVVRTLGQWRDLRPQQLQAHRQALHALELMRAEQLSLTAAAQSAGTTPAAVRRFVEPALERRGGRWVARPRDRLLRVMRVLASGGVEHEVVIRGSQVASVVGAHWSAIGRYLDTGDSSRLRQFRGKRAAGYTLETDPDVIDLWDRRGEIQVEDIYSLTS